MSTPTAPTTALPFDEATSAWDPATPTASAEELRAWQLSEAWRVAERLAASNPYYRPLLGSLPDDRSEAAFRTLPVTTKSTVVDDCLAHPPYGSRTDCDPADIRHVVETSGSSGKGREIYALDAADEQRIFRAEAVGFGWAGVRAGTRVLLTLPVGVTAAGLWYQGGLRLLGANVFSVGAYSTERKVSVLTRYGADVIVGTPSYLGRLAAACEAEGVDPASLGVTSLMVAGESYNAEWAKDLQARWGATLHEQYGCTEQALAWTCPGGVVRTGDVGVLHFPAGLSYCEVVDPATGEPAVSGGHGELIVTPLGVRASPLLRFATSDRVEFVAAGDCPCGRPLPGIRAGGVQRYDDMLKIKGVNVWPASFDTAVFAVAGVLNYQGTVDRSPEGTERVEIVLECEPESGPEVSRAVIDSVRRVIGLGVAVRTVQPGDIARSVPEGFVKVPRWRDRRAEPVEAVTTSLPDPSHQPARNPRP